MNITRRAILTSAVTLSGSTLLPRGTSADDDLSSTSARTDKPHRMPDLKTTNPDYYLREIRYANHRYVVKLANGDTFTFGERDIRFKTDASRHGPLFGKPVIISSKRGDRVCIVFASSQDMVAFLTSG